MSGQVGSDRGSGQVGRGRGSGQVGRLSSVRVPVLSKHTNLIFPQTLTLFRR